MKRLLIIAVCASMSADMAVAEDAESILKASGVRGGVAVQVGQLDQMAVALAANDRFLVHGLDTNRANVTQARQHIRSLGLYGRVSVDTFNGSDLPYRDNMVNLLMIRDASREIREGEIERVLAPRGVAIIHEKNGDLISRIPYPASPIGDGFVKFAKPVPSDIDDWTHYLHGPGNNAVSGDTVVGPPGQLQWKGGPEWARHHDHQASMVAMVSAAGRLFYIMDEGPISSIQLPPRWFLVARDAFNGKILWKRHIKSWWPHLWPNKKGFGMSPRRLVADSQAVYCTLGLNAPLTALDAATGSVIRTYPNSLVTEEFLLCGDTLFLVVTDHVRKPDNQTPELMRSRAENWIRDTTRTRVVAIHKQTGAKLWAAKYPVQQMTLAADTKRVYFHDGERIIALDRETGESLWKSNPIPSAPNRYSSWFGSTLVAYENVVLFAGGENVQSHRGGRDTMTALSATDGKTLWSAPHPASGYDSPEDLFVIDDLVWCAPLTNKGNRLVFGCRDGWVYCLRVADGAVIWRFRAAPVDSRLVACEQIESLWPVHGSVLIHEDEVHCTAGRSMFLEGGIRYLRLDLRTGKLIAEHVMDDRPPISEKKLDDNIRWPNPPTAREDLLSYDGQNFYMRTQAFDREGKRVFEQSETKPHLFLRSAFWMRAGGTAPS